MTPDVLTDAEQAQWRAHFRQHWQGGGEFNKLCAMTVREWKPEKVEMYLPFRDDLAAHPGVFHGGVVSALIDTAGCGVVAAGHDYNKGNRFATVALAVQYLSVEGGSGAVAHARCTRRGRSLSYAEVSVRSEGGKELAHGLVTVSTTGTRSHPIGTD